MARRGALSAVKDVLDGARDAPIDASNDDDGSGRGSGPPARMPDGCPVEPLGTEGGLFYFLTALGELRALPSDKVANKHIVGMFAPFVDYLEATWPRMKQDAQTGEWLAVPNSWKADDTSKELMRVAASRGVWNAREKVRGRGAWTDEDGRLILHSGNQVMIDGRWAKPGMHGGFVYPTAPPIPRPGPDGGGHAGKQLLSWLKSWNWARPSIDPVLLLGWIGCAMYGGALKWRPIAWITGDKATGKSTLQLLIELLFDGGLLQTSDATEAAVRQILGQQSMPVAIDEAEAEEDNRKLLALVKLARQAASGGRILRGGQDHQGHEFIARACFLFSSILVPPIPPQDRSRLAVLELGELTAGNRAPKLQAAEMRELGGTIRRRLADRWSQFQDVLADYENAMIDFGGHGGRTADQFGTLLAAAHVMLHDDRPDEEELAAWGKRLAVDTLAERADDQSEAERCLYHLGSSMVQLAGHGTPRLVADWLEEAALPLAHGDTNKDPARARAMLAKIGLGVFVGTARKGEADDKPRPVPGRRYIVVANAHQGLARQFEGSHWAGRSGASGVWSQALKRVAGAVPNARQRISGMIIACTLVPIEALLSLGGDDLVEHAGADERETVS
jgi:hypothetical protein